RTDVQSIGLAGEQSQEGRLSRARAARDEQAREHRHQRLEGHEAAGAAVARQGRARPEGRQRHSFARLRRSDAHDRFRGYSDRTRPGAAFRSRSRTDVTISSSSDESWASTSSWACGIVWVMPARCTACAGLDANSRRKAGCAMLRITERRPAARGGLSARRAGLAARAALTARMVLAVRSALAARSVLAARRVLARRIASSSRGGLSARTGLAARGGLAARAGGLAARVGGLAARAGGLAARLGGLAARAGLLFVPELVPLRFAAMSASSCRYGLPSFYTPSSSGAQPR